jgi:hypothetical protein
MAWIVETLNATVDAEIERLPADMRASHGNWIWPWSAAKR